MNHDLNVCQADALLAILYNAKSSQVRIHKILRNIHIRTYMLNHKSV